MGPPKQPREKVRHCPAALRSAAMTNQKHPTPRTRSWLSEVNTYLIHVLRLSCKFWFSFHSTNSHKKATQKPGLPTQDYSIRRSLPTAPANCSKPFKRQKHQDSSTDFRTGDRSHTRSTKISRASERNRKTKTFRNVLGWYERGARVNSLGQSDAPTIPTALRQFWPL